ncbi:MAG: hypothetical protein ACFFER_20045 [Candidatus Thorarchaeota archaeon]
MQEEGLEAPLSDISPKNLIDEVVAYKESPFRVAIIILTEKTMWLIVAEGEEDDLLEG